VNEENRAKDIVKTDADTPRTRRGTNEGRRNEADKMNRVSSSRMTEGKNRRREVMKTEDDEHRRRMNERARKLLAT